MLRPQLAFLSACVHCRAGEREGEGWWDGVVGERGRERERDGEGRGGREGGREKANERALASSSSCRELQFYQTKTPRHELAAASGKLLNHIRLFASPAGQ